MENSPRVLVGCPTYKGMKYCQDKFFERIKDLDYLNYDILIVDNSEGDEYFNELKGIREIVVLKDNFEGNNLMKVVSSRNKIIEFALERDYDYILMMDSDVIPPKNIINKLINWRKDIVSGLYFNYFKSSGKMKILPVAWKGISEKDFEKMKEKVNFPSIVKSHEDLRRHLTGEEINGGRLQEVMIPSAGCMLISKKVFEKIKYGLRNMDGINAHTGDDIYFIFGARKLGFKVYCDPKIKCDHLISGKFKKDSKGNLEHQMYK